MNQCTLKSEIFSTIATTYVHLLWIMKCTKKGSRSSGIIFITTSRALIYPDFIRFYINYRISTIFILIIYGFYAFYTIFRFLFLFIYLFSYIFVILFIFFRMLFSLIFYFNKSFLISLFKAFICRHIVFFTS